MAFTPFLCPVHGHVLGAPRASRVECSCGRECAPPGVTLQAHIRYYNDLRKKRRARSR